MSNMKYFALAGSPQNKINKSPEDAKVDAVWMDGEFLAGCMFNEASWLVKPFKSPDFIKHGSDELLVFIGSDPDDPENLNAEIELWIENDRLVLTKTCIVFVPAEVAHGQMEVRNLKKPVFQYTCHINTDTYEETIAEVTAKKSTYGNNVVEKYAPVDGRLPSAPPGFLTRLLWIDGKKLTGAPYMEAVWFHTSNDTGPETHAHDFDEFIGFIGSDPDNPEELGAEVRFFIEDEEIAVTKSCLIYIPRGVSHSPILVPRLDRPIIHFSGGNGGDYVRKGSDKF